MVASIVSISIHHGLPDSLRSVVVQPAVGPEGLGEIQLIIHFIDLLKVIKVHEALIIQLVRLVLTAAKVSVGVRELVLSNEVVTPHPACQEQPKAVGISGKRAVNPRIPYLISLLLNGCESLGAIKACSTMLGPDPAANCGMHISSAGMRKAVSSASTWDALSGGLGMQHQCRH